MFLYPVSLFFMLKKYISPVDVRRRLGLRELGDVRRGSLAGAGGLCLSVSASPPKSNKCSCHMVLFLQLWLSVAFMEEVKYWLALWRWFVFSKYWLGLLNSNLKWNLSIVNMLCLRETGSCNLAAQFNAFTLFSLLSVILPKAGMSAERDAKLSSPRYSTRLVTSAWPCFLIMYLQHINIGI